MKNKIKKTLAVMAIMAIALSSVGCACGKPATDSKNNNSVITEKEESSKTSKDESSKVDAKEEGSKVNSKDESSKTESSKTENSKTTSTESSKTQGGNNSTTSKPSGTGSTTGNTGSGNTTTQGCTHDWVQQYKTVHHDAVTHTEQVQTGTKTVVDQEGYEHEEIVGEQYYVLFSNGVEWEYDVLTVTEEWNLKVCDYCAENGVSYGVYSRPIRETRYVEPVTHEEPVYETRTVVDKDAYDEQVANGFKCSKCGATK